jgi:type III secretory pathway component EscS
MLIQCLTQLQDANAIAYGYRVRAVVVVMHVEVEVWARDDAIVDGSAVLVSCGNEER